MGIILRKIQENWENAGIFPMTWFANILFSNLAAADQCSITFPLERTHLAVQLAGENFPGILRLVFRKQIGPNIPDTSSAQSKSVSVQLSY